MKCSFADTKEKREAIRKLIAIRKEQIKVLENGVLKPLKDNIKIAEGCLKTRECLERLQLHSKQIRKHL